MGGAYQDEASAGDETVPAAIVGAIPPEAASGAVLGALETSGAHAFSQADGKWWRAPLWWVVTDRHAWLVAVHGDRAWRVGVGEPGEVALEVGWRRDAIRVGAWRVPLRRGARKEAQALYATWERARWGGDPVPPLDPRPAGRAPAARGASGLPPWWVAEVPADPEERWIAAAPTASTHPLSLPDGTIREETLWFGVSDRRAALAAHADGATWALEIEGVPSDTGAGGEGRFVTPSRSFAAPRRDADLAATVALAGVDGPRRWAAAATTALAARAVRKGLDRLGEAHERGRGDAACEPLARVLLAIEAGDLAAAALAEHLRRHPDVEVAGGPARWAVDARHLRVSSKAERIDVAAVRERAGALVDAIPGVDPPAWLPWPPDDETETWLAALATVGRWSDVSPLLARLSRDSRGQGVRKALLHAHAAAVADVDPAGAAGLFESAAEAADGAPDLGPKPWEILVRAATLHARAGDATAAVEALHAAVVGDFLRPEALSAALAAPEVAIPPALATWWRHLHRLLDAAAPDGGSPMPARERLDAASLDALHPGGAGWLEGVRTTLTPPEPPARQTLVRGLDRLDAASAPEAHTALGDVATRLGLAEPPSAWLYRGEGAWGACAWPLDPPLLLVGFDHLGPGPRHLDAAGIAFLLAVETTHLVCHHPLLAFDRDLLGTSRSVYAALGRWTGPAETAVDVLTLVPGIDQVAKIQTLVRLSKRLFQARGVVDKAAGLAAGVAARFSSGPDSLVPLAREGLQGAAVQFRSQADRAALLVTGDARAAVDAILRSSSIAASLADRARDEGLAAVVGANALPPHEGLRITMLVEFAARLRPDVPEASPMNPTDARANFTAWRAEIARNAWDADPHLRSLVAFHGRSAHAEVLRPLGALVSTTLDDLARETNRDENLPRLRRYDGQGHRTEGIEFHPGYHALGRALYATGVMSAYREPGREIDSLSTMYLYSQNGEAGHACPLACTAGLIKILQAAPGDHSAWLERLYDPDYDTHFHGSQFLTEVQGGSDVGANAVVAHPAGDGTWRITGEKWFCSVVDAHLFLVTARPEGAPEGTRGLGAFAVPRVLDGKPNGFAVRRLKYKLGTRSMASAEIDFEGAVGTPVGDFQRVVSVVLNTSRLYNAFASAGLLHRAWREADAYARTRQAFGRKVIGFPSAARVVTGIRVEAYAARGLSFALAAVADRHARGQSNDAEQAAWRMLVNLNKYWTSIATTKGIRDAIEIFGGNGAIEEFTVLPRLLRDSIVCEAWEGSHNVLCAQVLRDARRLGLHEPMFAWLEALDGPHPRLAAARDAWNDVLARPDDEAALLIRDAADLLRPIAQALALRAEARHTGSDPALPAVIDHLLATTEPGWSPLRDAGLGARIASLV